MGRRFGDAARIDYVNIDDEAAATEHSDMLAKVRADGLLFPVTVIDGEAIYDGSVSYPAILRQVEARMGGAA
jgi:disulfide oxidoreductase YuzD